MNKTDTINEALKTILEGTKNPQDLGEKVQLERVERGLSIVELARRSGVSAETIRKIEKGQNNSYLNTLIKIALGLRGE